MTYEYKLSKNDLDEIRYFSKEAKLSGIAEKSLIILSYMFGGIHNLDYKQRKKFRYTDEHCTDYVMFGSMATWDANRLTTLVVLAHELAVRVEISPRSFKYVKITFWERRRTGAPFERHPTLDEVLKFWRDEN